MNGPVKRASSVLLAGTIAILSPGLTPLAVAQQDSQDGNRYPGPPPVSTAPPSGNNGQPLPEETYKQETACVTRDLANTDLVRSKPWGQQYLQVEKVHELMRGTVGHVGAYGPNQPVTVALVDTGVRPDHPWLDQVAAGGDYVALKEPGAGLEDCDGHGTMVAGIIAAGTPSDIGFKGMAPEAQIVSFRQSSANYTKDDKAEETKPPPEGEQKPSEEGGQGGETEPPSESDKPNALREPGTSGSTDPAQGQPKPDEGAGTVLSLAHAIRFAADASGVKVMNVSINQCRPAANGAIDPREAKLQAALKYAVEVKDVVVVASAGNVGQKCTQNNQANPLQPKNIVTPPWFSKYVLSVAAIKEDGSVADFSMHGPWVSVAAPGTKIISLDPAKGSNALANLMVENGKSVPVQGTSFAAPYVSGLAALVRTKYPELNAYQVMNRIKATAQHPGAPGGRNQYVGYGMINPMAALTATVLNDQQAKKDEQLPASLPPVNTKDTTPMLVALGGAGGALVALLITLFTVHTIRRNRAGQA